MLTGHGGLERGVNAVEGVLNLAASGAGLDEFSLNRFFLLATTFNFTLGEIEIFFRAIEGRSDGVKPEQHISEPLACQQQNPQRRSRNHHPSEDRY